ncbi:hypothetical protein Plhal304r1_c019g0068781 [Plasmopara halstedii]
MTLSGVSISMDLVLRARKSLRVTGRRLAPSLSSATDSSHRVWWCPLSREMSCESSSSPG